MQGEPALGQFPEETTSNVNNCNRYPHGTLSDELIRLDLKKVCVSPRMDLFINTSQSNVCACVRAHR